MPRARAPQREATAMKSPRTTMKSSPQLAATRQSLHAAMKTQRSQKKKESWITKVIKMIVIDYCVNLLSAFGDIMKGFPDLLFAI